MTPAGRYYHVSPRFWRQSAAWSEDARTLGMYLTTSPHRNMVALYYCPLAYMTADLGWDGDRLQTALEEVVGAEFAHYDYEAQVVFVPQALEGDPPTPGKRTAGAVAVIRQLPPTTLLDAFTEAADRVCPSLAVALRCPIEASSKTHRSLFEDTSKPLRRHIEDRSMEHARDSGDTADASSKPHRSLIEASSMPVSDRDSSSDRDSKDQDQDRDQEEREKPPATPDPAAKVNLTIQERETLQALHGISGHVPDFKLDLEHVRRWLVRFAQAPILDEIDKCVTWWTGPNSPRTGAKPNWRSRIRNWLQIADDRRKEREKRGADSSRPAGGAAGQPVSADAARRRRELNYGIIRPDGSRETGLGPDG